MLFLHTHIPVYLDPTSSSHQDCSSELAFSDPVLGSCRHFRTSSIELAPVPRVSQSQLYYEEVVPLPNVGDLAPPVPNALTSYVQRQVVDDVNGGFHFLIHIFRQLGRKEFTGKSMTAERKSLVKFNVCASALASRIGPMCINLRGVSLAPRVTPIRRMTWYVADARTHRFQHDGSLWPVATAQFSDPWDVRGPVFDFTRNVKYILGVKSTFRLAAMKVGAHPGHVMISHMDTRSHGCCDRRRPDDNLRRDDSGYYF